jgi:hypothetical protein
MYIMVSCFKFYVFLLSKIIKDLTTLINKSIFDGLTDTTQIQNLFATSNIQANLKGLLSKLLMDRLPQFKRLLLDEQSKCYE